jgi:hypothetical protein
MLAAPQYGALRTSLKRNRGAMCAKIFFLQKLLRNCMQLCILLVEFNVVPLEVVVCVMMMG